MSKPSFAALEIWTAAKANNLVTFLPDQLLKTTDGAAFPSTTALANDEDLVASVSANYSYEFYALVMYTAGTTADLKLAWTFPTSASLYYRLLGLDSAASSGGNSLVEQLSQGEASGTAKTVGGAGIGNNRYAEYRGRLEIGSTAGQFILQRAQSVSTAENTKLLTGSSLTLQRVS